MTAAKQCLSVCDSLTDSLFGPAIHSALRRDSHLMPLAEGQPTRVSSCSYLSLEFEVSLIVAIDGFE